MQALDKGNFDGIVDTQLQNDYSSDEMTRMVACAAACVRHSARLRPRMSQVIDISSVFFGLCLLLSFFPS